MFNLLVSSDPTAWESNVYEVDRSRFGEYTVKEIQAAHANLDNGTIDKLKSYPTLFAYEESNQKDARIGWITSIKLKRNTLVIKYDLESTLPLVSFRELFAIRLHLDIDSFEVHRNHWAIKDEDLFTVLVNERLIDKASVDAISIRENTLKTPKHSINSNQIFIVHGHNDLVKISMARFISELGFEPIILHEQPNAGRTIIEKIESYSNVGFGVILYTPCDVGCKVGANSSLYRARQNVVFEHGFLIGKLTRPRVSAFVKGDVETPNDISGMVYTQLDDLGLWKQKLVQELVAAGYSIRQTNGILY
jgi:predicted nucleotide-binding protein